MIRLGIDERAMENRMVEVTGRISKESKALEGGPERVHCDRHAFDRGRGLDLSGERQSPGITRCVPRSRSSHGSRCCRPF